MNQTIIDELLAYAHTDLLYHRAAEPEELVRRQRAAWDPLLAWVEERYGCRCATTTGIMPMDQPPETTQLLARMLAEFPDALLLPFAALTRSLGSIWLALALKEGRITTQQAMEASRIDEHFQQERWGVDEEAQKRAENLSQAIEKYSCQVKSPKV